MTPSYPQYKHTDSRWLKKIPSSWGFVRFKYLFKIRKRIAGELGHDVLSITQKGVKVKDIESGEGQVASDYTKYQLVKAGDFAMNHMDLLTGFVDISKFDGVTSPDYRVFSLIEKNCVDRYCLYLLQIGYLDKIFYPLGQGAAHVGRWRLPADEFLNFKAPIPSHDEQLKIVKFLDKNLSRIDSLIEEKHNFVNLLEEKRQALISHVVTKGLDDKAKMKNSGVEWIGKAPINSRVVRFRYIFSFGRGLSITKDHLKDEGIKVVNYGEIHSKYNFELDSVRDDLKYVDKSYLITSRDCLVSKGDFVFADTSEDLEGSGNFTHLISEEEIFAGYHTIVCRLKIEANSRFISYFLDSSAFRRQVQSVMKGVKVFSISQKALKDTWICLPSLTVQNNIADYLDTHCSKINLLKEETYKSIELLKEHRSALISAAVTGKIDVRELV